MSQNNKESSTSDLIRLSFFTEMGKSISRAVTIRQTLQEVMHHVQEMFTPRNWSLLLLDHATDELVFTLVTGGKEAEQLRGRRVAVGQGITGWIAKHGEPVIIEDVQSDSRFDPSMDEMTKFNTESIIGVPLISGEKVFGVIELINKLNGSNFTPLDLKILSTIADFAAIAIEKAYYYKALRKIATIDSLTGLYNRRSLIRQMEREINRCKRYKTPFSMLMIDIDAFKKINDTKGHSGGDKVLKHFGEILAGNIRQSDFASRYGGDEFVVMMPNTEEEAARDVRDRILKILDKRNDEAGTPYTVSIGLFSGCPENLEDAFNKADFGLYEDKNRKKVEDHIEEVPRHITEFLDEGD
ncbi:MAG: diguanylate cyclase [Spirochaetia bacterium]